MKGILTDIRVSSDLAEFREKVREIIGKFPSISEHLKAIVEGISDEDWPHEAVSIAVYDNNMNSINILTGGNIPTFTLTHYYNEPDADGNEYISWDVF